MMAAEVKVTEVARDFMKYKESKQALSSCCKLCNEDFQEGHNTNLATFSNDMKGQLICDKCSIVAIVQGAKVLETLKEF